MASQSKTSSKFHLATTNNQPSSSKTSKLNSTSKTSQTVPEQQITAYLSRLQKGGHIQPFGCMIAIDDSTFKVIAFSENARERLALAPQSVVPGIEKPEILTIGTDVKTLFTPSSSVLLERAFRAREITLLNPLWVHSKNSGTPFNAILHRIDDAIVIDLEPAARTEDPALSIAGAVQSQNLAMRAISSLQALAECDVNLLCDTVVRNVRELTGYDRVMVYRFHEDEHGEVVAECKRDDLDPYIGLHYPATDIPHASRVLFLQNRVRMIVDCRATPVRVVQDDAALTQPLSLVGSTLRAPDLCHARYMANMGSIASLVMAVVINGLDDENERLWGLVVCHHTSPCCVPFPLRYACEFLMQAFGERLNMELQLASQMSEKRVLRTQTLLCDMLLRDSLTDKLYFAVDVGGRINGWNAKMAELTGLSVEEAVGKSLVRDLVYKEAEETVAELLYRALRGEEDKSVEIKLKTFSLKMEETPVFVVVNACSSRDYTDNDIVGVCFVGQDVTGQKVVMDKFIQTQGDYKAIIHSPSPLIPPIIASDENTCGSEWNTAMEKLTGWGRGEVIGKMLVGEVFGSFVHTNCISIGIVCVCFPNGYWPNGNWASHRAQPSRRHTFDQKRLKQPLYRHPWEDVLYIK